MKKGSLIFMFLSMTLALFAFDKGDEEIVKYEKYGSFHNVGTGNYRYFIKDIEGLKEAVGQGIFPDFDGIKTDSDYIEAEIGGKMEGYLWDFIDKKRDYLVNFYKWATTPGEPLGVKLFYVGYALEKAGMVKQAIKSYHAILIHHPKSVSYTYWHTPIYLGKISIDRIHLLTRKYPEMGIKLVDARIKIENGFDNDVVNDKYTFINPGKLIKVKPSEVRNTPVDLSKLKVIETRGGENVSLKKYDNGHWQLYVKKKPFFVRGVGYSPNQVGKSPDYGTLQVHKDWQLIDLNSNNKNDVFFESYVDKNKNNSRDKNEPRVGDARLLKDMGVNTLRLYHHCYNKKLFRELYKKYGFYIILGDYLGAYTIGSGADWHMGTDYSNPEHRKNMIASVKKMVKEFKNEPYVLMWALGNEINYGYVNNAKDEPEIFYEFVNEVSRIIHKMDPTRPVVLCNGETHNIDIFAKNSPETDIFGINSYRGYLGFGDSLWSAVKETAGKPVLVVEYGCCAYAANMDLEKAEQAQMEYHRGNWDDIWYNRGGNGYGNCLGGVVFEWTDEWWKAGTGTDPSIHDTQPQFGLPFIDGWSYEEWLGICSQGDGSDSPYLRQPRKVYYYYKKAWNQD